MFEMKNGARSGKQTSPAIVDLFCGGGGFSLGARQAGFKSIVAVDKDRILTSGHSANFPKSQILHSDISRLAPEKIIGAAGAEIEGVIGGPPCQAFSEIGAKDPTDPRRHLVRHFFRLVAALKPKFFVMENVPGIAFEKYDYLLDEALAQLPGRYEVLDTMTLNSEDFGAPTSRRRVFIVGYDRNRVPPFRAKDFERSRAPATVKDAIYDLRNAKFHEEGEDGFRYWKHKSSSMLSAYAQSLRGKTDYFTGNDQTEHTRKVRTRFEKVVPGETDAVGKHPRLSWNGQCPTLRAGTGSDKGSFQSVRPIHPSEPRVITVREAARLQGFPDWFVFHPTTWHSFRMIGNSVSPIVARSILKTIRRKLAA